MQLQYLAVFYPSVIHRQNAGGMTDMKNPAAHNRRLQLRKWIDERFGGVQAAFIASTNDGEKQLNQGELSGLLGAKSFGEKRARSLEKQAGMPSGYLDQPQNTYLAAKVAEISASDTTTATAPSAWPFARVSLRRLLDIKRHLGGHKGVDAMHDIDETLEMAVLKWERRIAQAKSRAA